MSSPPRSFVVADLNVRGELQLKQTYDYATLEAAIPEAADLISHFATHLWRSPEEFEIPLSPDEPRRPDAPTLRWRASASSAGIMTIRAGAGGELASVSMLACGLDPAADRATLEAFQR